jgi:hypothetical protein
MKKLVLIMMTVIGSMTLNAQTSRSDVNSKIGEFTKLTNQLASGQRVNQEKLTALYNGINCMLIDVQAEAIDANIATTREETCGSSEFPKTQTVTDDSFKKYAEAVKKYLAYKK